MMMQGEISAPVGLPKYLLLTVTVICLSVWPQLIAQTTDMQIGGAKAESNTSKKPPATKPAPLAGQEPIEFEKTPKGYPIAELEVRDLAFSPDGKFLAAGYGRWNTAGQIVVFDFAHQKVLNEYTLPQGVSSLMFSPDGKYLAATYWETHLEIRETKTWKLVAKKSTGSRVARLDFSLNGKYLAVGTEGAELFLWNVGQWDEERVFTGELFRFEKIVKVAFSPDSQLLVAVGGRFGRGLVFEVESGQQIAKFDSGGPMYAAVEFSPDGKEIVAEYSVTL